MALTDRTQKYLLSSLADQRAFDEVEPLIGSAANVDYIAPIHDAVVAASFASSAPGKVPPTFVYGDCLLVRSFPIGAADGFYIRKIPYRYAGNAAFHAHWTKTSDANESGKSVRWRITYRVYDDHSDDITAGVPYAVDIDDTYDAGGTTSRIIHESPSVPAAGFLPGYYVAIKVEAVAPGGTPMASDPGLVSLDLTFSMYINK